MTIESDGQTTPYTPYYPYTPYTPYTPYSPYVYGKPVAVLSVDTSYVDEDETMRFSGDNSYDQYGGTIEQYLFDFGDGETSPWISDDLPYAYHSYNNSGTYYARLKVKDNEGVESAWSNSIAIRVAEGTGTNDDYPQIDDMTIVKETHDQYSTFRCEVELFDENEDLDYVKFKWYLDDDVVFTSKEFVEGRTDEADSEVNLAINENSAVKCEVTVYDKEHNIATESKSTSGYVEGKGCGFEVVRFDYNTYLMEGKKGWVEAEVKNTGGASGTVTLKLYVDGVYKEQASAYVRTGESESKKFEFTLAVGNHKALVEISTPCGGKISRNADITIFPASSPVYIPTTSGGTSGSGTQEIKGVDVIITPESMDIEIDSGETVSVYIQSPATAKFAIAVEGLPDNWANYPAEVEVTGSKTAYIYIVPKTVGNYEFKVKVTSGTNTFEKTIELYVAPAGQKHDIGAMTGLVSALESNWLTGAVIVAILAALTVLYFIAGRGKLGRKKYEDHVYGERKEPYYGPYPGPGQMQPRMMKGSVAAVRTPRAPAPVAPKPIRVHVQTAQTIQPQRTAAVNRPQSQGRLNTNANLSWPDPADLLGVKYSDGTRYPKFGMDF